MRHHFAGLILQLKSNHNTTHRDLHREILAMDTNSVAKTIGAYLLHLSFYYSDERLDPKSMPFINYNLFGPAPKHRDKYHETFFKTHFLQVIFNDLLQKHINRGTNAQLCYSNKHEYTIWTKVLDNGRGNFSHIAHFKICKLNVLNTQVKNPCRLTQY